MNVGEWYGFGCYFSRMRNPHLVGCISDLRDYCVELLLLSKSIYANWSLLCVLEANLILSGLTAVKGFGKKERK